MWRTGFAHTTNGGGGGGGNDDDDGDGRLAYSICTCVGCEDRAASRDGGRASTAQEGTMEVGVISERGGGA